LYIPGFTNQCLQAISTLVPTVSKVKYVSARWTKSQADLAMRRLFTQKQPVVEKNLQGKPV
jgi:hypothetical protein